MHCKYIYRHKTAWHENAFRITGPLCVTVHGGFTSQKDSNAKLWYCCLYEHAVKQIFELPVKWDGLTFMWRHHNEIRLYIRSAGWRDQSLQSSAFQTLCNGNPSMPSGFPCMSTEMEIFMKFSSLTAPGNCHFVNFQLWKIRQNADIFVTVFCRKRYHMVPMFYTCLVAWYCVCLAWRGEVSLLRST